MLVLSRKSGERILVGDQVSITVVRIGPNSVRLGIDAPRNLSILREELCDGDEAQEGQFIDIDLNDASATSIS